MKQTIINGKITGLAMICAFLLLSFADGAFAGSPQIPNIFLNNVTQVEGKALVHLFSREFGTSGTFAIRIGAVSAPPTYPAGNLEMDIDMSDSSIFHLKSTTVEALSSTGKHSPTAYIMGRCEVEAPDRVYRGCHYWITLADNSREGDEGTPDIVGFLVLDGNGNRIAYGTGPVEKGDIFVAPTSH